VWPWLVVYADQDGSGTTGPAESVQIASRELFERLQEPNPGLFPDGWLPTLQRWVKAWRHALARKWRLGLQWLERYRGGIAPHCCHSSCGTDFVTSRFAMDTLPPDPRPAGVCPGVHFGAGR
jgi:hypothetical protein